jgi:hypothetical protein
MIFDASSGWIWCKGYGRYRSRWMTYHDIRMHWAAFNTINEKVRVLFRDDALNVSFHVPRDLQLDTIRA